MVLIDKAGNPDQGWLMMGWLMMLEQKQLGRRAVDGRWIFR
jgi:hypothetical protein